MSLILFMQIKVKYAISLWIEKCNKNVTKTFNCSKCNLEFNNRQTKWRHEKTCTKNNEAKLKAEIKELKQQKEEQDKKNFEQYLQDVQNGNIENLIENSIFKLPEPPRFIKDDESK